MTEAPPPSGWSPQQPPPWAAPGGYAGGAQGASPQPGAPGPQPAAGPPPGQTPWPGQAGQTPWPGQTGQTGWPGQTGQTGWPGQTAGPGQAPWPVATPGWGPPPQAPKPGVVPLRPLGLGEILDGAVTSIRQNPRTFLGLAAVLSVVSALVQFFVLLATMQSVQGAATGATSTGGDPLSVITSEALVGSSLAANIANIVSVLVGVIVQIVATGMFTVLVGAAVLGTRLDARQAWARTRPQLWRLVGLTLLSTLAVVAVFLVAVVVGVVLGVVAGPVGILAGVVIGLTGLAASVWIYVLLVLAPAALVLERVGVVGSIRRSIALTRGSWWRIFGIFLLTQVIASLVASVLVVPLALIGTIASVAAGDPESLPWPLLITTALGQLVSGLVTLPFVSGVTALLYVDRRIRREALDLRLLAAARGTPAAGAAGPVGVTGPVGAPAGFADPLDAYRVPTPGPPG